MTCAPHLGGTLQFFASTTIVLTALAAHADDTVYSLDTQFDLKVGSHHFQRIKIESTIADTLHNGRVTQNLPVQNAELLVVYDVEILEKKLDAGPTRVAFTVKSGKASLNSRPTWAPRPGTRMDVRRNAAGYDIDGFPEYLDPLIAELVKLTFSQVSDELQIEHDPFMPKSAKIGDVWSVDLEAVRRMQRGHSLSYDDAKLEGNTSLAARATLGDTDVLVIETNVTAEDLWLVAEPDLPKVTGTGDFKAQVVLPIDMTLGPKRFRQESHFVLRSQPRDGKTLERDGTGTIQIDYDYPE
jgi:hypothetical protein